MKLQAIIGRMHFFAKKKKFEKWMALMCIGTQKRGHKAATVTQVAIE